MVAAVAGRTFIVRITAAPQRVVVEDVRTRRRVVPPDLDAIGACIAIWMDEPEKGAAAPTVEHHRPVRPP
jgi:hypothetical protein